MGKDQFSTYYPDAPGHLCTVRRNLYTDNAIKKMDEPQLIDYVVTMLKHDFYVEQEVEGIHLLSGQRVRIDIMVQPLPHLKAAGFPNWNIGIEVKTYQAVTKDLQKAAWQAMCYSDSQFGDYGRPSFVLLYPSWLLSKQGIDNWDTHEVGYQTGVRELMYYAKVGYLSIYTKYGFPVWGMSVGNIEIASAHKGIKQVMLEGILRRNYGNVNS